MKSVNTRRYWNVMGKAIGGVCLAMAGSLSLVGCGENESSAFDCGGKDEILCSLLLNFSCRGASVSNYEDLKDGTIRRTISRPVWVDCKPTGEISTVTDYFKKCIQGQVYRSLENDCRGAGSTADDWGAIRLEYCTSDDFSCEENKIAIAPASPAAASCAAETLGGRTWKIAGDFPYPMKDLLNLMPELPIGVTKLFWVGTNLGLTYADFDYVVPPGQLVMDSPPSPGVQRKTNDLFVWCKSGP